MAIFAELDFLPSLKATLLEQRITKPTEIQAKAMPELLAGRSVVGVAETGSGKTLTYALPMLHFIKSLEDGGDAVTVDGQPRGVVIVPSRELGEQVARVFKTFTHTTRVRVRSVLGGTTMEIAKRNIKGPFEILIATPGRLSQIMAQGLVQFSDVRMLVLDEADQLLDMGFLPDVHKLVGACPANRQLALFSATVSQPVEQLIARIFRNPIVIKSKGSHRVVATLRTLNRTITDGKRWPLLETLLGEDVPGGTILFTNTREQCDKLAAQLADAGHKAVIYRGEMDKVERRANLKEFRDGAVKLLIATDLGGRGLDVESVGRVINYHLPQKMDNYLHRVGRTARAGREGTVINFVTERDAKLMETLALMERRSGR